MADDDNQASDELIAKANYLLHQTIEQKIEDRLYHQLMKSKEISDQLQVISDAVKENHNEKVYTGDFRKISFLLDRIANHSASVNSSIDFLAIGLGVLLFVLVVLQALILWKLW